MHPNPWNWSDLDAMSNQSRNARSPSHVSLVGHFIDDLIERIAPCPWSATAGQPTHFYADQSHTRRPLYTSEERIRRDSTVWTTVQGVLAPIQFAVFLVSLLLVINYLRNGVGYELATASVILKTLVLYTIMITGAIWEKKVFGKYLFAPAFFWEDALSMVVIGLHTAYLVALLTDWGTASDRMMIALSAYAAYAVNAAQFILKLRAARLEARSPADHGFAKGGAR